MPLAAPAFSIPNWDSPDAGIQLLFNHMSMWKGPDKGETYTAYDVYETTRVQGNLNEIFWQFPLHVGG